MNLKKFKIMHSELICCFQLIENNLKWIYAAMVEGKTLNNRMNVNNLSLTQILIELRDIDNSDKKPFISKEDYNYLHEMAKKRNYWCHQAYLDFACDRGLRRHRHYKRVSKALAKDYKIFKDLSRALDNLRLKAIDKFC